MAVLNQDVWHCQHQCRPTSIHVAWPFMWSGNICYEAYPEGHKAVLAFCFLQSHWAAAQLPTIVSGDCESVQDWCANSLKLILMSHLFLDQEASLNLARRTNLQGLRMTKFRSLGFPFMIKPASVFLSSFFNTPHQEWRDKSLSSQPTLVIRYISQGYHVIQISSPALALRHSCALLKWH